MQFFQALSVFIVLRSSLGYISKISEEEASHIRKECTVNRISKRSIDGKIAANHQFKHTVRIYSADNKHYYTCTGVLISSKHVIAAAHCFWKLIWGGQKKVCDRTRRFELDRRLLRLKKPLVGHHFVDKSYNIAVQYGARCILINDEHGNCDAAHQHKNVLVKQVVIHPMFLYDFCHSGDIAILDLEHPIQFSNEHDTALNRNETTVADFGCLPKSDFEVEGDLSLPGFGIDPRNEDDPDLVKANEKWLKYINVTMADSCLGFIGKETYQPVDGLCTQSTEGVLCEGDSAGPLVFPLNAKKDIILAVHSKAMECTDSKDFLETNEDERLELRLNKHTDLRYHLRWICALTGVCTEEYKEDDLFEKPVVLF